MKYLLIRFLGTVFALYVADYLLEGVTLDSLYTACIVAIVLGVLHLVVRPVLVVLTLPVTLLTFGLFLFVLNGLLLWFVGTFVQGLTVENLLSAILASLLISLIGAFVRTMK